MSAPGERNLTIVHGDDYSHRVTITDGTDPIDLTGRTYRAQIRFLASSTGTPDAAFAVDTTDAATGVIVLDLTDTQTAALVPGRRYSWDLEETASGATSTLLAGSVSVRQDVSRS